MIRILLFRVLYSGPLFSETPIFERHLESHLVGPDERQHPDHQKPTWENAFSCREYLVFFEKPAPYKINSLASHVRSKFGTGTGCKWEFPKIKGTLFWGPYNKDPTI